MGEPEVDYRPSALGSWAVLPVLGLLGILVVISFLPGSDCDGYGDDGITANEIVLIALAATASLGCVAATVRRLAALGRAGSDLPALIAVSVLGVAAILAIGALSSYGVFWGSLVIGTAMTGLGLLVLLISWLMGRNADQAGVLVPLYLLGAALFVYPGFTVLALAVNSGAFC